MLLPLYATRVAACIEMLLSLFLIGMSLFKWSVFMFVYVNDALKL